MFLQILRDQQPPGGIQLSHCCSIQKISPELPNFGVKIIQLAYPGEYGLPAFHRIEAQALFKSSINDKLGGNLFRQLLFEADWKQEATFRVQSSFVFAQKTNHL